MSITNKWEEQQYISQGSFAKVYKVKLHGKVYALKKMFPHLMKDAIPRETVLRQIEIMSSIDHPNIIKLHKAFIQEDEISLLLQYASGGSLFDQLQLYKKIPQKKVKKYVRDIIQALDYLHNRDSPILHRDIKPQNLLIDSYGNCKLADFGSANLLNGQRTSYVGTDDYMAPQMLQCIPHGIQIDIWTLGVLIYQLLTGKIPINCQEFPSFISRPAEDVIKKLLNKDQSKRMTIKELKSHIWLCDSVIYNPLSSNEQNIGKIQFLKKRLQQSQQNLPKLEKQSSSFVSFTKQKSTLQENQELNRQAKPYILLIKQRDQLKQQYLINQRKIQQQKQRRLRQRPFVLESIKYTKNKIKQYEESILELKSKPLKMQASCRETIKTLKKKIEELKDYTVGLSERTKSQLLYFPSCQPQIQDLPLSQYIYRLKTFMMSARRDALLQLKYAKKISIQLRQMRIIQQQPSNEEKYEYCEQSSQSSLNLISKHKFL